LIYIIPAEVFAAKHVGLLPSGNSECKACIAVKAHVMSWWALS
jgi:hypothetical protein